MSGTKYLVYSEYDSQGNKILKRAETLSENLVCNGNLGIGTTNPGRKLDLHESTDNHSYLRISGKTAYQQAIEFYDESGTAWIMYKDATTRKLNFHNGSGNKLTLLQNGNLGIGATDPFAKLDVKGTYTATIPALGLNNGGGGTSGPTGSSMPQIMLGYNGTTNNYAHTISTRHHGSSAQQNAIDFYVHQGSGGAGSSVTKLRHNMTMDGARVGIGTTGPSKGKLHIEGTSGSQPTHNNYFNTTNFNVIATTVTGWNQPTSCYASGWYGSGVGFIVESDSRIKCDIADVSDDQALVKLRQLQPKTYKYVDKVSRGNEAVYGFISQEVKAIIPNSVSISTKEIPDIYELADISSDGTRITLSTSTTGNLQVGNKIRLIGLKTPFIIKVVSVIVDTKTFVLSENLDQEEITGSFTDPDTGSLLNVTNKIFVFGREVNDFHDLNKDAIWTVATAALQEVDRQLQAEKAKVATLETEMAAIKAHLNL